MNLFQGMTDMVDVIDIANNNLLSLTTAAKRMVEMDPMNEKVNKNDLRRAIHSTNKKQKRFE